MAGLHIENGRYVKTPNISSISDPIPGQEIQNCHSAQIWSIWSMFLQHSPICSPLCQIAVLSDARSRPTMIIQPVKSI